MATELPPALARVLTPLLERPATTAVITDFDGTLAPIVSEPAEARPIDGAAEALARLARRFGVVAVVSGRPASFLLDRFSTSVGGADLDGPSSIQLVGLYGLEVARGGGQVVVEPGAERWRAVVAEVAGRLAAAAPSGVEVEPKGLAVTVHWRRAPEAAGWVQAAVATEADRSGLRAHPARMSLELGPPTAIDKGAVVRGLVAGCTAACYFGDDLGDLPAFAALAELKASGHLATASIAAVDAESAPEVAEAADAAVEGPSGTLAVLEWLAAGTVPETRES